MTESTGDAFTHLSPAPNSPQSPSLTVMDDCVAFTDQSDPRVAFNVRVLIRHSEHPPAFRDIVSLFPVVQRFKGSGRERD